jgi:ABC-type dipeptide/oligopeptide/nickel transport system permease subunit
MLTEKDMQFITRWERVREEESTFKHKFLSGLPMAFLFGLPVLIFFVVVQIFFPSWFTTATHKSTNIVVPGLTEKFMKLSSGDVVMAFIAVVIVILFFSYFRMHYKWETNEQLYKELKSKEKKRHGAAL